MVKLDDILYRIDNELECKVSKCLVFRVVDSLYGPVAYVKGVDNYSIFDQVPIGLIDNPKCGEYFTQKNKVIDKLIEIQEELIESYQEKVELLDCKIIDAEMKIHRLKF